MPDHIVKAFDADLQEIAQMIAQFGGLAEKEVADATDALKRRDTELAKRVLANDEALDLLRRDIEEKIVLTITRRQPMASDLREVVGALRVVNDLERIGDLAKNIGKRVESVSGDLIPNRLMRRVERMAGLVLVQLRKVLDAYAGRDLAMALDVWRADEEIDNFYTSLFRELLTYMMEDPRNITFCLHLIFCAKNIERMGDHATNIAETIYFMIEGRPLTGQRPKADMTTAPSPIKV
jgi:phosphate transport system protein